MTAIMALIAIGFMLLIVGAAVRSTRKPGSQAVGGLWLTAGVCCWLLAILVDIMLAKGPS